MQIIERGLSTQHYVIPVVVAIVYVLINSKLSETMRMRVGAISAAGFPALYLNGGFGAWEFVYALVALVPAYYAQQSFKAIGVAWLMHGAWDLPHHLFGNTIWLSDPSSSLGCAIMDPLVAVWYFAGAPSIFERLKGWGVTRKRVTINVNYESVPMPRQSSSTNRSM